MRKIIKSILSQLVEKDLVANINKVTPFNDDPKIHHFSATIRIKNQANVRLRTIKTAGFSQDSAELALLKCLCEAVERYCQLVYDNKSLKRASFDKLSFQGIEAINPLFYRTDPRFRFHSFSWHKGVNFLTGKKCLIPTQLVYFGFDRRKELSLVKEMNTSGSAFGFSYEETLLRAIYELVERDAYMSVFLNKITPKNIAVEKTGLKEATRMLELSKRYRLELFLLDITNDLKIPSFMTILVDKTGLGQAISVGLKSSLDPKIAILGSMEECLNTRPGYRREIYSKKTNTIKIAYKDIRTFSQRSLFWSSPSMLKHINFLLEASKSSYTLKRSDITPLKELSIVRNIFQEKNIPVYYADVTIPKLLKEKYYVYKAIIPSLQALYICEADKELNKARLRQVANYFGEKSDTLNPMPHIFL